MVLSREEIAAAIAKRRAQVEQIDVPEWGGKVYVRLMTPHDVEKSGLAEGKRDAAMFARVIVAAVCDENAKPLFNTKADQEMLAEVDIAVAARVFAECMRVNGLMDEDLEKAVASFSHAQNGSSSSV